MRIVITGNLGFIGSRLEKALVAKGHDVFGIDKKEWESNLLYACWFPQEIDAVYHLAAQTSVEGSWADPFADSMNYPMTVRVAEQYPEAKIIYASSAATIKCSSPYGLSKKCAEQYLKKFHKDSVILVLPNIFGGGRGVVDLFKGKEEVTVYGDGMQVRDYVHVDDVVAAFVKALHWSKGRYELSSGKGTTVLELAEGRKIRFEPARKEVRESVLENTTPDWDPAIDVIDYMK